MSETPNFQHQEFTDSDSAIRRIEDDVLGRGRFCFSLANVIADWRSDAGLVIGLHGVWGSGKTSVKNLVVSLLEQRETPLTVIEFNPWSWSGEDKLSMAFFEEIGNSLPVGTGSDSSAVLAATWRKYSAHLTLGSSALRGLSLATEAAGVPWAPLLLRGLATAADETGKVTDAASKAAIDDHIEPLSQIHDRLRGELAKLKAPILVVLDDIDRLSKEEITILFRLVKANANFPNLVFLTLYDRAIVEKALDDYTGSSGTEFLKKIVQVTFDLPSVDRTDLDGVLTDQLQSVIGKLPRSVHFDFDRFQKVYSDGLAPFFSTLRDIKRFFSSFAFHVEMFFNDGEFEADLLDLLCLETLRVFEPVAYRHLELHHECVFGPGLTFKSQQEQQEEQTSQINELLAKATKQTAVHGILCSVFPQIGWIRDRMSQGIGFEDRWNKERRACSGEHFDRYFQLSVEQMESSSVFLNKLIATTNDSDAFCDLLLSLGEAVKIAKALRRFELIAPELALENPTAVIKGLYRLGDEIPSHLLGFSPSSPDMIAWRIVSALYLRISDPTERATAFCTDTEETSSLWFPCRITALEEPDKGEQLSPQKDILTQELVSRATEACAKKIAKAAENNEIAGSRMMFYLYRWRDWSGDEPAKAWVANYVEQPEQAVTFLRWITREVFSSRGTHFEVNLTSVSDFIEPEVLKQKVAGFLQGTEAVAGEEDTNLAELRNIWVKAFDKDQRDQEEDPSS